MEPEGRLVKIADLVGKDVKGLRADGRTRLPDGSFLFAQLKDPLVVIVLTKVQWEYHKISSKDKQPAKWLYWYWDPVKVEGDGRSSWRCGYSGTASPENWEEDHLLILD